VEPDVWQDAAAEEERLAGEVLGEEEHVAESVEGAMEVALGGDLRQEPLLLVPGPVQRGKAVQSALAAFATLGRDAAGGTARERELIRCVADAEANAQMVGGVKVSVPAPL
jgi:hypothetical protein